MEKTEQEQTANDQPLGVLAIDPDKKLYGDLQNILRDLEGWEFRGGVVDWEGSEAAARERDAPSVYFVNLDAGVDDAMGAASTITSLSPDSTILGVSETENEEWLLRGMRSGFRDFLRYPLDEAEVLNALSRIEERRGNQRRGKVITLFCPKGGSGKTTLAVNLATYLAKEQKKRVGLIDLDLDFGDISFFLNISPTSTIGDLASGNQPLTRKALKEALVPHDSGIEVLTAPLEIHQAEKVSEENVGRVIREMQEIFDFVLINTACRFSPVNLRALDTSNTILLLTLPHLAAIAHTKSTIEVFRSLGYEDRIKLVINRLSRDDDVTAEDVESALGMPVLMTLPSDYRQVMFAINRGLSLLECAPRSPATRAIVTLAQKLCRNGAARSGQKGKKKKKGALRFF
jgi:pilus assembly protein CpaE